MVKLFILLWVLYNSLEWKITSDVQLLENHSSTVQLREITKKSILMHSFKLME